MADLSSQDRLQPALLDRLTDDEPESRSESRDKRVLSARRLREALLRDLNWLLNTSPLSQTEDLSAVPFARASVLDYGMTDLTGVTLSSVDETEIERRIKQAILEFEPRILRRSLRVRATSAEDASHRNAVAFDIEGELWGQPSPTRLYLRCELDLEDGSILVQDRTEGGGL